MSLRNGFKTGLNALIDVSKVKYPSKRADCSFDANLQQFIKADKTVLETVLSTSI